MNIKKIVDYDNVQCYYISNPTKAFKKRYPKKFILSLDSMGKHVVMNVDSLPSNLSYFPPIGYIFTYSNTVPKLIMNSSISYEECGSTMPRCLDSYFVASNTKNTDEIDLILSCSCKNDISPPGFIENIIIRSNSNILIEAKSKQVRNRKYTAIKRNRNPAKSIIKDNPYISVLGTPDEGKDNEESVYHPPRVNTKCIKYEVKPSALNLRNNIMTLIVEYLKQKNYTVEKWIHEVITKFPVNNNGLPLRFPDVLNDNNINEVKLSYTNLFIEYDFRASDYDHEMSFIQSIEDGFENMESTVMILDSYNGILQRIIQELKSKGFPWRTINKYTIEVKIKYLRLIDVEYEITDFI